MRNPDLWCPSKFVKHRGCLRASRDTREVRVGSRLMADRVAACYERYLSEFARGDLIDLGCGKVPLYDSYRGLVRSVTCVDWENSAHPSEHLDVACDLTQALPFGDRSFDTIILSDVLEHLPEPALAWSEMARMLRPGGVAFVNVPFYYPLHEKPHDFYRYTEFALHRFAERHAFDVVVFEPLGGSLEVFGDLLSKHLQFVPVAGAPAAALIQNTILALGRTARGARLRNQTSRHFPLGYFLVARHR